MELKLQKGDFYVGITCDDNFYIVKNNIIGKVCINICEEDDEKILFIEWVELYPEYRGKKYFRSVLSALIEHYQVRIFNFESSEEFIPIYQHLGAKEIYYDEHREMHEMRFIL